MTTSDPPPPSGTTETMTMPAAPQIVDFGVQQVSTGVWLFTGRVIADDPTGLVVYFGGAPNCVQGQTATTDSDGYFSLLVNVQSDGSDSGTVSVVTYDGFGQESNTAYTCLWP